MSPTIRACRGLPASSPATSAATLPPASILLSSRAIARTEPPSAALTRSATWTGRLAAVDPVDTMGSNLVVYERRYGDPVSSPEVSRALPITAIDHVGIAVPDLDAAIAFQVGVLGGVLTHRETNTEQGVEEAMIAFGDGAQIQLLAPLSAESTIARFLDRNGPGLQQLAFRVDDVRAAAELVRAAGVRTLYDEPRRGTAGSSINFLHPKDAGGVLVELVQPTAGSEQSAEPGSPQTEIGVASAETAAASGTMAP